MGQKILIKQGRVIDPDNQVDAVQDILIEDGKITKSAATISAPKGTNVIDASGKIVCPGFIDMHCHLREPGYEDKETIASGTMAAAAGGFTVVCTMPNTQPHIDSQTGVKFIIDRARTMGKVRVLPIATITIGSKGEDITDFGDLVTHGAIGFSDDGSPVQNSEILRRALEYTSMLNVPIIDHCEDLSLTGTGVMYEGKFSTLLGLKGIPSASESSIVARDIELADFTRGWIHICHVSVARSVELIRSAKERGVKVTAEVTPHHLTLTDEAVKTSVFDTSTKVKPPLASEQDRQQLIKGLLDGTIDIIATDHAPHTTMEKDQPYLDAPFGIIGFETAFAAIYTYLVKTNLVPLNLVIEKMTASPARLLKLKDRGALSLGNVADVTIIDLEKEWTVRADSFFSRSRNCPFMGKSLSGKIVATISEGQIVFE